MFGRRKVPFGSPPASPPPPPPGGKEPFPIEKMDRALDGAIRLLTRALDDAGADAGELAIRGAVPDGVTPALADCTTYRGEEGGGFTYLVLGLTPDFKQFMYPPHCRLYFIINSTGICEDPHAASIVTTLAPHQFPGPLLDAHMMKAWIRFILPCGEALRSGQAALEELHGRLMAELMAVIRRVPARFEQQLDLQNVFRDWAGGFPGTIGRPLTPEVERMNGLPMTPFIAETLTKYLAEMQAQGLRDRP